MTGPPRFKEVAKYCPSRQDDVCLQRFVTHSAMECKLCLPENCPHWYWYWATHGTNLWTEQIVG